MPPREGGEAKVLALFGPTGVGKTAIAVAVGDLIREAGGEAVAVSADALQVYAGLEALTGAPTATQLGRLEHRLVGSVDIRESFSVGEFMPLAHEEIDAALRAGRRPIVVGGTGLYLRAALCELDLAPPPAPGVRERIEAALDREGPAALHAELEARSPALARGVAPTDRSRIARSLELLETAHSDAALERRPGSQLWSAETRHPTLLVGLMMERQALYRRIDERVDRIVAGGAPDEVRRAEERGPSRTARKALGYDELLAGDVEGMKRRTRKYAKRQLTWMRKMAGMTAVDVTGREATEVAREVTAEAGWLS